MTDIVDELPDSAMEVENGLETENYVMFRVTDVIEWYTVSEDGTIKRERFVSDTPVCPEDIPIGLDQVEA